MSHNGMASVKLIPSYGLTPCILVDMAAVQRNMMSLSLLQSNNYPNDGGRDVF